MIFRNLSVESIAVELPLQAVSTHTLETRLGPAITRLKLPARPIELLTGIQSRLFWEPGTFVHEVAAKAGQKALDQAGIRPDQVGLLISTSVSRDFLEPSTASVVHGLLKLPPSCRSFDVANACLGFLDGITLAGQLIEAGIIDYALLVDGESAGPIIDRTIERLLKPEATATDFWNQFATMTLGSAAVAMVLGHSRQSRTGHRVSGAVSMADTTASHLCRGTSDEMVTDSIKLLKAGVELARRTWARAIEELPSWSVGGFSQFIFHQVGKAHAQAIREALALPEDRCFVTYPFLGNTGPASVPITLAMAASEGRIHSGEQIALMGIGSGLNVAMMALEW
jgi:3-oxoacyl-[acyl-carrier-protein] synthase-3